MPETQWMTLTETADMMKRMPEQVTQMCEDGKLEYYLEDGRYFVSRESIDLFMHPPIGQPAPVNPDANGTPRRQYGQAPHDTEPSPESALDMEAIDGPDEVDAGGGSAPEDNRVESPGRGDEVPEAEVDAQPEEDVQQPQIAAHAEEDELQIDAHAEEDEIRTEPVDDAPPVEDAASTGDAVPVDDTAPSDEVLPGEYAGPEPSIQDGEHAEDAVDPGEPGVRAAEILADLRAAIERHAMEHKAFCDEIAGLADALESTLSRDDDKTNELTKEISSLLARYTRR